MNKRITAVVVGLVLALLVGPLTAQARYLNPNTGRFQTMDSFEGNSQDPLSLHKYNYAHSSPTWNVDPSGNSAWVVTRPLNISLASLTAPVTVHVFLAFDWDFPRVDPWLRWANEIRKGNQDVGAVMPAVEQLRNTG